MDIGAFYYGVGSGDYADFPFSSHRIAAFSCVPNDCELNTAKPEYLPEGYTPPGDPTISITGHPHGITGTL